MNREVKIKRNVTLYITKGYMMAVFFCKRMFNPVFVIQV